MNIPIISNYFNRIQLYNELKKYDKRNGKLWNCEKTILKWASKQHEHLNQPLSPEFIIDRLTSIKKDDLIDDAFYNINEATSNKEQILGNLVERGYAIPLQEQSGAIDLIKLTKEGLDIGDVIQELGNKRGRFKYQIFPFVFVLFFIVGLIDVPMRLLFLVIGYLK